MTRKIENTVTQIKSRVARMKGEAEQLEKPLAELLEWYLGQSTEYKNSEEGKKIYQLANAAEGIIFEVSMFDVVTK